MSGQHLRPHKKKFHNGNSNPRLSSARLGCLQSIDLMVKRDAGRLARALNDL